jgi:hypothetical protein
MQDCYGEEVGSGRGVTVFVLPAVWPGNGGGLGRGVMGSQCWGLGVSIGMGTGGGSALKFGLAGWFGGGRAGVRGIL